MNREEIFRIIASHTRVVLPDLENHQFRFDDALKDLGANSIDRSEIVMLTLESLSLKVPLIDVAGAQNMGELADILYEKKLRLA